MDFGTCNHTLSDASVNVTKSDWVNHERLASDTALLHAEEIPRSKSFDALPDRAFDSTSTAGSSSTEYQRLQTGMHDGNS